MTDKGKIRAEIEKRYRENKADGYSDVCEELWDIISFIDSLQEEPVSEDLEKEMDNYLPTVFSKDMDNGEPRFTTWFKALRKTAHHFAEWQKQQLMKDAIEYTILDQDELSTEVATFPPNQGLGKIREGDNVKIIIVKED